MATRTPECNNNLESANDALVNQGTFQSVVDIPADMRDFTFAALFAGDVDSINNGHDGIGGRCGVVLPAIDSYFRQASDLLVARFGDSSLVGLTAVRPIVCQ